MAFEVHTPLGLGTVTETDVVRGRTSYKVAGRGFDKWFDETDISRTAGAFGGGFSDHAQSAMDDIISPREQGIQMSQHRTEPSDEEWGQGGGDQPNYPVLQHEGQDPSYDPYDMHDPHGDDQMDLLKEQWAQEGRFANQHQAWAPVNHDNSVNLPYNPRPQYPAIPGDTESTLQPIHRIDADERLHDADSITFENRGDDESDLEVSDNFLTASTPSWNGMEMDRADAHEHWKGQHAGPEGDSWEHESPYYDGHGDSQDYIDHLQREGMAFLIPLIGEAAGAMGAGGAAAGAGGAAAGSGAAGAIGGGLGRGLGMGAAENLLGGGEGEGDPNAEGGEGGGGSGVAGAVGQAGDKLLDATAPGAGWGGLIKGSLIDSYLRGQEKTADIGAGLSDRYIDLTASADYHNDPVAQFRHDPHAFIERIAHVEYEPVSPEMEHYGQLVESNKSIREAAWSDVRAKAMRLRREGRIAVKDVAPDRIYASVEGDHGTYEVMIAKEGAFGGFGGGHAISNWRCGCEWGRWAFQRRHTYIGRLCSHGYATYMEMQSQHTKGQERLKKQTRPYRKRADALQDTPQRLVPELVVNDTDDAHQFLDVTEDDRKDTGPDDIVSEQDIVHFARVMDYCDRNRYAYPCELTAFLVRHARDDDKSDWKIEDASGAESALNEIRDWSDSPLTEDLGHLEERNDQVRDAVDEAREKGTDASLFTAGVQFRTAAPGDSSQPKDIGDMMGVPAPALSPKTNVSDPSTYPGVKGGPNSRPSAGGAASAKGNSGDNGEDPTGGLLSAPYAGGAGGKQAPGAPSSAGGAYGPGINENASGGTGGGTTPGNAADGSYTGPSNFYQQNYDAGDGAKGNNDNDGRASQDGQAGSASSPGGTAGNPGGAQTSQGGNIGQGEYKIQSGDTLSDIAQRSGYGDNYQALGDANGISNYDMINAGGTLNIGKPGGDAAGGQNPANPAAPGAGGASDAAANPATSTPPAATTDAVGGAGSAGSSPATTDVATGGAGSNTSDTGQPPAASNPATMDTGTPSGGAGDAAASTPNVADTMSQVGDAASSALSMFSSHRFADQADYNEWVRYAYPDGTSDHKPFNGSGGDVSIPFSSSEGYADKARKKMDDVEDLEHHNVNETDERFREAGLTGVRRLGGGPSRRVQPEVIREQRPSNAGAPINVQAAMESFGSFDPLAARSPEDYDSVEAAAVHTASQGGDFVAQFQREFGASIMSGASSGGGGGGQFDDFSSSPAVKAAMMRTAGRNYSLAEQNDLIREGDRGGAGNLASLDLRGTHYEDDGVGLFT